MAHTKKSPKNAETSQNADTDMPFISENDKDDQTPKRNTWDNRIQFLLAIVGYTVGIGSMWRFPTLCARNGGGAFLVPFFFFMITSGGPLYYMEVCLGQFSGRSAGAAFEFCPLFKGLGLMMVVVTTLVTWYYMTINAWALYYFYNSFSTVLPWSSCGNWWNTPQCLESSRRVIDNETGVNVMDITETNVTFSAADGVHFVETSFSNTTSSLVKTRNSAEEFWMFNVLRQSSGLEEIGSLQWHLVIGHIISYTVVILTTLKGAKTLGKVVYVTATLPYLLLTILLVRGLTLDGAFDGVLYYVKPDFNKLFSMQVWLEAALQVFFSLGPAWGGVITMASYNKFHQKSFLETIMVVVADAFTAFYCGLVVFAIIGFLAKQSNTEVDEIARASGHGLAFIAYPTACSQMPLPQLWSVLFFLALFSLALDSNFGMYETITTAVLDWFPRLQKRRILTNFSIGIALFLLSLPILTNGGIYLFTIGDWYISAFALFVGSIGESVLICWVYGVDRFSKDIMLMTGRDVSVFTRALMMFFIPISLLACLAATLTQQSTPTLNDYTFQAYAIAIGVFLGLLPICVLICTIVWQIYTAKGSLKQRILRQIRPASTWGPNDPAAREIYSLEPYHYPKAALQRLKINVLGTKQTPWI